jgi:TonB-linked SusC/RagA family outer membrane protein
MYRIYTRKVYWPDRRIPKILLIMKLTTVLLIGSFLHLSAAGIAQNITFSKKNVTLEDVLTQIRKQSGFNIVLSDRKVNLATKVDVNFNNTPVEESIKSTLSGLPLSYKIDNNTIIIREQENSLLDKVVKYFSAIDVRGRVVDENGKGLAGATVTIKGSAKRPVITDDDGRFFIPNLDDGVILVISFVGYELQEIKAKANLGDLRLSETSGKLEEVSVTISTGYQTIPKERVTGSFTTIDNKTLNRAVSPDILGRLKGITNGLLVDNNVVGGFNIRGKSTIFSEVRPLIVLDNFPFEGNINTINPNDVENITILKDAAAASIWGVRAGNGVIVITTKKGKLNQKASVNFNANLTIGDKPNLNYQPQLSSSEFIDMEQFLFGRNAYAAPLSSKYTLISPVVALLQKAKLDPTFAAEANSQINALRNIDVRDQQNKYFLRTSSRQQYNVNINGGGASQTYFFSAGYDKNLPNQIGPSDSRFTIKGNNSYSLLNDKLKLLTDITLTKTKTKNTNAYGYKPFLPYEQIADANGNPLAVIQSGGLRAAYTDTAGNGRLLDWKYRPLEELRNKSSVSNTNMMDYRILLGVDYKILNSLNLSANYQYFNSSNKGETNFDRQSFSTRNRINTISAINSATGQVSRPIPVGDIYSPTFLNNWANYGRAQLSYNKTFNNKHNVNGIAGYEVREDQTTSNGYTVFGYFPETGKSALVDITTTFPFYNGGGASQIGNTLFQDGTITRNVSYYANASYEYDQRFIFSGSYRKDKSNLFGVDANQKGVPLWSAGVAWNLHKEDFFNIRWLSNLQLKATYGYNGNVNRSVSAYLTAQAIGNNPIYSGNIYYNIINPPNNSLRWERVKNLNFGLDFGTKANRLTGSIEYYIKEGIDLIGSSPIAPQTGVSVYTGNSANTFARGIDFQINSINLNGELKWFSSFILNYNKDKITDYKVNPGTNANIMQTAIIKPVVGYPINALFGYRWRGLDAAGNPQGELNGTVSKDYAGISNLTDYSQLDYKGSSVPTLYGNIRNTFSYKNLELSFNISYKANYYFRRSSFTGINQNSYNYLQADYSQRWQSPGDELITNVPAIVYPINNNRASFYSLSSILIEKGDHIRLQDIQINYTISKTSIRYNPFNDINIYCYASNLGILWRANKQGIDPEVASGYPIPKMIAFGIKTNF